MNQIQSFLMNPAAPVEVLPTLMNFFLCIVVAFIVRSFYIYRSLALTGKQHIGSILPILSCIIFLVIVIVKSSLALSLGLVGRAISRISSFCLGAHNGWYAGPQ